VTLKWRHLTGSHFEVAIESQRIPYTIHFTSYKAIARIGGFHVTENDVTWPQGTGSDPEMTSLDRKSPGSGCRSPKTCVNCTWHFLQGCSSQEEAVTWQEMTSHDLRWPEVTRKWRHLTRSHQKVAVEKQQLAYTVHFTSYKAVANGGDSHVTGNDSCDLKWPEVTLKRLHLNGNHMEEAVEGPKTAYTVHFTSYKAVACRRRQSCDKKWRHVTSGDRMWHGSDVIWPEVTWK